MPPPPDAIRFLPLATVDPARLQAFYNSLPPATIRTFRPFGDSATLERCRQVIAENLADPRNRYDLIAQQGTEPVGWAYLADLTKTQPYLGIVVAEPVRRKGLGKALMAMLLGWARFQHLPAVYLMVVQDNEPAINLYRSLGFEVYDEEFDEIDQLSYFHMVVKFDQP